MFPLYPLQKAVLEAATETAIAAALISGTWAMTCFAVFALALPRSGGGFSFCVAFANITHKSWAFEYHP